MRQNSLVALPVFNEVRHVNRVLDEVVRHVDHVLVIDDGSDDGTAEALEKRDDVRVLTHQQNRGYGAALISAFQYAAENEFDTVVTIDCDGQHEPKRIPEFVEACSDPAVDIVSGSRYLKQFDEDTAPPEQRLWVNRRITTILNQRLGFELTDAFCGFKAYRVSSIAKAKLTEPGYAMPLELWVQAACLKMNIVELPVPLIYLQERRSFGGVLDDVDTRLRYYESVLDKSFSRLPAPCHERLLEGFMG